jgi:CubicO group peptidase (beta-lactamase class C family)
MPVAHYIPEFATGMRADWRSRVTPRHLLTHTSGLPAHQEYFRTTSSPDELFQSVLSSPFAYEPGTATVYSDPGFILLGRIIERATGKSLDALARERIFAPLEMNDTAFTPAARLRKRIAPTEFDRTFRKCLMHGEVHDENAWRMGGVAGHAGMFTTARDLAIFSQMMLNGGIYAHKRLLRSGTVEQFTTPDPATCNTRTLGWMVPTENSTSGRYFSHQSYGHTGYTGTSMWIDLTRQMFVVLLTNRVHPTRDNTKIQQVRPAVHDAIAEALGIAPR